MDAPSDINIDTQRGIVIVSWEFELVKAFKCADCDEISREDDFDDSLRLYECGDHGMFSADSSERRCPECNKFATKLSDRACPSCQEGSDWEEVEAIEVDGALHDVNDDIDGAFG